jgi:MFS family permease
VGALILGYLGRVGHKGLILCAATLVWTSLLVAFAVTPWFWLALALMLLIGAWNIVSNAMSQALVQALAPDDKRGRVMGLYGMLVFGPRVLSGPLLGGLALALGAHAALGVLGAVVVLAVGALIAALPALRELE